MKLINFSHPLNPDAERVLHKEYGVTEIVHYPIHLDLNVGLDTQVQAIVEDVRSRYGEPDVIIPPGYAPAAILLAEAFPYRFIRLTSTGTPPKWMPAELLYLGANPPIPVDQVVQLLHAINAWFGENPEAAPHEPPWAEDFYALMEKLKNKE